MTCARSCAYVTAVRPSTWARCARSSPIASPTTSCRGGSSCGTRRFRARVCTRSTRRRCWPRSPGAPLLVELRPRVGDHVLDLGRAEVAGEGRHPVPPGAHERLLLLGIGEAGRDLARQPWSDAALALLPVTAGAVRDVDVVAGAALGRAAAASATRLVGEEGDDEHERRHAGDDLDDVDEAFEAHGAPQKLGKPNSFQNQMALVNQIRTSVTKTVPPTIGSSQLGSPCVRTARTLIVNTPKKKQPSSEWTSTRVSVDWNPSAQRHWYATGSVSPNATIPVSRCASPNQGGDVRGTWILSYRRNASSTCTAARKTAAVANHTLKLIVSEKKSV